MYLGAKILNICQNIALYAIKIANNLFLHQFIVLDVGPKS